MPVPSTGPLELRGDINLEVNGNVTDTNVALRALSAAAGFSSPDAMSDFYGYSSVTSPTVVTNASTNVVTTSMTINGNITDTGQENPTRGFYFGTNSSAATNNTKLTLAGTQGTGVFSCNKSGLTQGTAYYVWAFGCNSAGEGLGSRVQTNTPFPPFTPTYSCGVVGNYLSSYGLQNVGRGSDSIRVCAGYFNPYSGGRVGTYDGSNGGYRNSIDSSDYCCGVNSFDNTPLWGRGLCNYYTSCTYRKQCSENSYQSCAMTTCHTHCHFVFNCGQFCTPFTKCVMAADTTIDGPGFGSVQGYAPTEYVGGYGYDRQRDVAACMANIPGPFFDAQMNTCDCVCVLATART